MNKKRIDSNQREKKGKYQDFMTKVGKPKILRYLTILPQSAALIKVV